MTQLAGDVAATGGGGDDDAMRAGTIQEVRLDQSPSRIREVAAA